MRYDAITSLIERTTAFALSSEHGPASQFVYASRTAWLPSMVRRAPETSLRETSEPVIFDISASVVGLSYIW